MEELKGAKLFGFKGQTTKVLSSLVFQKKINYQFSKIRFRAFEWQAP